MKTQQIEEENKDSTTNQNKSIEQLCKAKQTKKLLRVYDTP